MTPRPKNRNINLAFILGAGASKPYGFPVASELRNLILGRTDGDFSSWSFAERPRYGKQVFSRWLKDNLPTAMLHGAFLEKFQHTFDQSEVYSIDRFVFNYPEYASVAQHYTALILLECERLKKPASNWYRKLWNEVIIPRASKAASPLEFITFNYDRSWASYLDNAARSYYPKQEEALYARNMARISHVYGSLGPLSGEGNVVCYGETDSANKAGSQIKLISPRAESRAWIAEKLEDYDRLVFLGFGFDELNMETLGIIEAKRPKEIYASCFGLSEVTKTYAEERMGEIKWGGPTDDVESFLHKSLALA